MATHSEFVKLIRNKYLSGGTTVEQLLKRFRPRPPQEVPLEATLPSNKELVADRSQGFFAAERVIS